MDAKAQKKAAGLFAAKWKDRGAEKQEGQIFWAELLSEVFGVKDISLFIRFEQKTMLDHAAFIDGYIESTHVLIEQKSKERDLDANYQQSDHKFLTPFQQAQRYSLTLPYTKRPRWIVTCNFREFRVYDMENPYAEPQKILLAELEKEVYRLAFLVDPRSESAKREEEVSIEAGRLVAKMRDALLARYNLPESAEALHSLNVLCVRLVFCLYAEDGGLFPTRTAFHDYLAKFAPQDIRKALLELFSVLDTPIAERDQYLPEDLAAFPYVNGGLFKPGKEEIPLFTPRLKQFLLEEASAGCDWSRISPTIFGAVFESTLNPETRRTGGMHYTSPENIHKLIDPLFLDELETQAAKLLDKPRTKKNIADIQAFQRHLGSLVFLDPACGSGNFLTESYISLRRLENKLLKGIHGAQQLLDTEQIIFVGIGQFHGMEINDFAVSVAKTALWIAEIQMAQETERILSRNIDPLPLKNNPNIVEADALHTDWASIVPPERLDYIMGNPPFSGARLMGKEQKAGLLDVFGGVKNAGNIDFVTAWFELASRFMQGTKIRTAFVATNSVTQGEQPAVFLKPIFARGQEIDFAHTTFKWQSESLDMAAVHYVIIGFSEKHLPKTLYTGSVSRKVKNINQYLQNAPTVFVESRQHPLCNLPEIGIGNKPIDGGNYLFSEEEKDEFLAKEPSAKPYFRRWYGADEFINNRSRWCLWLGDCSPHELHRMPHCLKRVEAVRELRLASKSSGTRKLAERPARFHVENMPKKSYVVIPETSSENRKYVPIGFMTADVLCSNALKLIPNATLAHFGVVTSLPHMAWMRMVAGRLEMRYRYSKDIVYNNFPWPSGDIAAVAETAREILTVRKNYPECSLAELYDERTMPPDLRKVHKANDRAVMQAYGFGTKMTEEEIASALLLRYASMAENS